MMVWLALGALYLVVVVIVARRMDGLGRGGRWAVGIALVLVGLPIDGLLLGEAYVRWWYRGTDTNLLLPGTHRWLERHVEKNARGFRDDPWDSTTVAEVTRIGVVGGGEVFGMGIEDPADRFTNRLERQLNETGAARYDVLNISEVDWNTHDHVNAARQIVPTLDLDELIVVYTPADIADLAFGEENLASLARDWREQRGWLARQSRLVELWKARPVMDQGIRVLYTAIRQAHAQQQHRDYQAARLRRVVTTFDRTPLTLRFVILPMLAEGWEHYSLRHVHDEVRRELEAMGVETRDLLPVFETAGPDVGSYWASRYDIHPNEAAHALIAETIVDTWYDQN